MRRINHPNPENTHMFRSSGLKPFQLEIPGRDGLVCGIHNYAAPNARGMERCPCGAKRHKDTEI